MTITRTVACGGSLAEGYSIGILALELAHRYMPGNVQNARSFRFPVVYQAVRGVGIAALMRGERSAEAPVVEAALELQRRGVSMVVGACGSFAYYQHAVSERLAIPAILSILCEIPFLIRSLPHKAKLGVVFAATSSFTDEVRRQCGIGAAEAARVVPIGVDLLPSFQPILKQEGPLDQSALDHELVGLLWQVKQQEPEIRMWLLQCSDLPPCAPAIRSATGLAVFDMTILIEHLYRANTRDSTYA
jgi:hypothetical protein